MKAYFAAMKKLLFLGACLVALASQPVVAQTGGTEVAVVQMTEIDRGDLYFVIVRNGVKTEEKVFESVLGKKGEIDRAEAKQKVLQQLYQQGFTLIQATVSGSLGRVTTWVFDKKH